ncbi:MAG TPA: hypothetical protein PKY96_16560 [Flavobacteriales bacterium]|nr:hypothetical protein [Flavobacteriales bacterium]
MRLLGKALSGLGIVLSIACTTASSEVAEKEPASESTPDTSVIGFVLLDSLDFVTHGKHFSIAVLRSVEEEREELPYRWEGARPFLLYERMSDGRRVLQMRNDSIILCRTCGGVFGEPYEGIEFKDDTLLIRHYGGSSWRWAIMQWFVPGADYSWPLVRRREINYSVFDPDSTMEVDAAMPERPAALGTWNNYDR